MKASTKSAVFIVVAGGCLLTGIYLLRQPASQGPSSPPPLTEKERAQAPEEPLGDRPVSTSQAACEVDEGFQAFSRTAELQIAGDLADRGTFELDQRDPRAFVRRSDHEITPGVTREPLTREAVPVLHALLDDPAYRRYWSNIAKTICYLSDDPASASVIINYIRRSDDWREGAIETHRECTGKLLAIRWLGFLGGEEAERVLIQAMSPDGARELVKAWLDGLLPVSAGGPDDGFAGLVGVVQGSAAIGIVHAQSREGIQRAEALHEAARADFRDQGYSSESTSILLQRTGQAMAIRDLIQSMGIEGYLEHVDSPGFYKFTILPRAVEYGP